MPSIDIATPVSSAPSDRLALGVVWVRPSAGVIGGTLNPSYVYMGEAACMSGQCFEGNEE